MQNKRGLWIPVILFLIFGIVNIADAATLTQSQIDAVLQVLTAFGVDSSTVSLVQTELQGGSATSTPSEATSMPSAPLPVVIVVPAPVSTSTPVVQAPAPILPEQHIAGSAPAPLTCTLSQNNNWLPNNAGPDYTLLFSFGPDGTQGVITGPNGFISKSLVGPMDLSSDVSGSSSLGFGFQEPLSGTSDSFTLTVTRGAETTSCSTTVVVPSKVCTNVGGAVGWSCVWPQ